MNADRQWGAYTPTSNQFFRGINERTRKRENQLYRLGFRLNPQTRVWERKEAWRRGRTGIDQSTLTAACRRMWTEILRMNVSPGFRSNFKSWDMERIRWERDKNNSLWGLNNRVW